VIDRFANCNNLKYIGLLHSDLNTINSIATNLPKIDGLSRYIYLLDTPASSFTNTKNVKYLDYRINKVSLYLPQPLRSYNGVSDRLYWDSTKHMYCIEKKVNNNGTGLLLTPQIIELSDYTSLIELDVYNPVTSIFTNSNELTNVNITVQIPYTE
jgi:hypothetical protein